MGIPDMPCGGRISDEDQQPNTAERENHPQGASQNPRAIQGPALNNLRRKSTRKAHGKQKREDAGNPAAAATTNTTQGDGDTHAQALSGSRPTPPTSKARRARSGWCGFSEGTSGYLPGALGRVLGR